jgi:diguanylate cyclase (GGDEF)-like protein/PAS domain S-box-containing protein
MFEQITFAEFNHSSLAIFLFGVSFLMGYLIGRKPLKGEISDRQRTEATLHENSQLFRNLIEASSDWVWEINEKAIYTYISPKVRDLLGYEPEEVLGKSAFEFMPEAEAHRVAEFFASIASKQKFIQYFKNTNRHKDGRLVVLETTAVPILDAKGQFCGYRGIDRDITKSQQTETALQESEALNRAILSALPDLIFRCSIDGTIIDFKATKDIPLLLSPREFIGKNTLNILPSELVQSFVAAIAQGILTGETQTLEYQLTLENKLYDFEARIVAIDKEQVLAFVRDISERQAALRDRKQAALAQQESEERLKSIINNIYDGLIVVDNQGKIQFVNPAAVALFGRSSEELLDFLFGIPFVGSEVTEICIHHANGEAIVAQMQVREITWEDNIAHLVSLRNVTESYQAKQKLQESEAKYRRIVETATEGIWVIDRDNKTSFVNPQMAQMLGYTVEEMMGKSFFDFLDEEEKINFKTTIDDRDRNTQQEQDVKFRRRDGEAVWAIASTNSFGDRDGNYAGSLSMITDITDRKRVEQALFESEQRLQGILASVQDVIWSEAADTLMTLYVNLAAEKVFGRPASEFYNDRYLWFKIVHPDDKKLIKQQLQRLHETGRVETEYRIVRPDGEVRWLYTRSQMIYDAAGKAIRVDGTDTDITERKLAQTRLQYNAFYDPLTDLPNRALFMDRLEHALQRTKRHPESLFAVLFLDLDGFKLINDSLGHLVGDRLLQAFARRLSECLRPCDTLARLGGDEFTILLEDIKNVKDAILVAERILQTITLPFLLDTQQVFTNTSIGIALSDINYQLPSEILRDADTAMYAAKAQGKGCFVVFDPRMYHLALSRLQLETDLRSAIASWQEFQIYYQPIVSLETGRVTEFEALIRWQHPEKGLISPAEFIPIAEETGLIVPIGQWILTEACQQMRAWQEQFSDKLALKISVNLSSKQLKSVNLLQQIDDVLAKTSLEPEKLKLEITESLLIENIEVAADLFLELNKRKIELCLDDFGTGYSSLSYLHRFPIDTLKIDRSFIMQIKPEDESIEIVRAIVVLAHILGMNVIAEGIETEAQLEQLKKLNCQQGQGYLFSKPLSKTSAEELIKTLDSK